MKVSRGGWSVYETGRAQRGLFVVGESATRLCWHWSAAHGVIELELQRLHAGSVVRL